MTEKQATTPADDDARRSAIAATTEKAPPQVPRWLVRTIWAAHRAAYRLTRRSVRAPAAGARSLGDAAARRPRAAGAARPASRSSATSRTGSGCSIPAMNGWADPEPAWWLNLQATPVPASSCRAASAGTVLARGAVGEERAELWRRFVDLGTLAYTDASAAQRARETAIVVLEPIDCVTG